MKRVGRKLTKKRKPQHPYMQYPEKFKDGDDAQEDVAATTGKPAQYMNQSVFSMIAAAGSKVDFHARFEDESSDSEDEDEALKAQSHLEGHLADTHPQQRTDEQHGNTVAPGKSERQQEKSFGHQSTRSLPKLSLRTIKERKYMSQSSRLPTTELDPPLHRLKSNTPRDAPVMSRMLEAQAQLHSSSIQSKGKDEDSELPGQIDGSKRPSSLVVRLKEIFEFETPEEVISGSSVLDVSMKRSG